MTGQEFAAYALGLAALAWIGWRWFVRRRAGTCCGERTCPAAKRIADRLERAGR